MNDRYLEALEQYEMEVTTVRKGRGAWICETDRGMRLLKEYRGTVRRLEFEDQVLGMLDTRTSLRTDQYERNKEGELLTMAGDGTRYILKEWYGDRECNIRDGCEVRQAIARLAMLHGQLRRIPFKEEWNMGSICKESPDREMDRHIREMQKARNFIRGKRGKTEFELSIMGSYDYFYEQARAARDEMKHLLETQENETGSYTQTVSIGGGERLMAAELFDQRAAADSPAVPSGFGLCHGDLDQHHVLMGRGYMAIVEYNRMHLGLQVCDLYRLMRKALEKHGWDTELGLSMVDSYQRVRPMDKRERKSLTCMFLFPEKYWKQLNFYYNTNKAWIPAKSTDKVRNLESQEAARRQFIRCLTEECG